MSQQLEVTMLSEIESVGIELEGGWCENCIMPIIDKYRSKLHIAHARDGSVEVDFRCRKHKSNDNDGEFKAWAEVKELPLMFRFVKELFATKGFHQNDSCGNHIHIRFKNKKIYEIFAIEGTWSNFIRKYRRAFRIPKYLSRLSNYYTDSKWEPDLEKDERRYKHYKRYKMINLQSLYEPQHTLEFRILPHFRNAQEAINSYSKLLGAINELAREGERPI